MDQKESPVPTNQTHYSGEILLAQPRGFCAGVDRAISIVNQALEKFGQPIYVRHEIVHNQYVVAELRSRGVDCRYWSLLYNN